MRREHFCNENLLPGECITCLGHPRPFVVVQSWAGAVRAEVEILARTPKQVRIRFLTDSPEGRVGDVRLVQADVVRFPKGTT